MKPLCYKDTELLSRLPVGKWFAAGALSIHWSKLDRLVKLGVLEKRWCPSGLKFSRKYDYRRPR